MDLSIISHNNNPKKIKIEPNKPKYPIYLAKYANFYYKGVISSS